MTVLLKLQGALAVIFSVALFTQPTSGFVPVSLTAPAAPSLFTPRCRDSNSATSRLPNFTGEWATSTTLWTTTSSAVPAPTNGAPQQMSKLARNLTKVAMVAYIAVVAISLVCSLSIIRLFGLFGVPERRRQIWALKTGQRCARYALRLIPFCNVKVIVDKADENRRNPEPSIWVCNHTSMLDVFLLLASDKRMRGFKRRPIKVVYVSPDLCGAFIDFD
jgi:hypothetical protein